MEDNPVSFRVLALEKGLGSQNWARQLLSLSLFLSGWSKPMPLTSHCKTPQSSSYAGQKQPFNAPPAPERGQGHFGAIPGDQAWSSISPGWKPLSG